MSGTFETLQKPFDLQVFVCTNVRATPPPNADGTPPVPAKQSCGPLGAENIRAELKGWLQEEVRSRPKLAGNIKTRVNGSGCLDFCKRGIAVAIYPQGEFMLFVKNTPESVQDVKDRIIAKLNELESR
ncbi:hypothetical protein BH10BDE1_BH10BDE1_09160 [soil metagenome]